MKFIINHRGELWFGPAPDDFILCPKDRVFTGVLYTHTRNVAWLEDSGGQLWRLRWSSPEEFAHTATLDLVFR